MGDVYTSISFNSFKYCSNSLSEALIMLYLLIRNTIGIYLHSIIIICNNDIKLEIESRMKNGFSLVFPNGRYFK